ncbi:hypothetical protein ILUMI_17756 [Ignelater luminosus]|uniref:Uncharacterized protein n=1 Tax=Ignelater luminosus TaxID=2038154 RepID=A0A8K0G4S4_IGNLU|nr:hypothetical protein ILUMI_17756 [Ignelater luminosus]
MLLQMHIQVYKLTSNEYRFFPVTVSVNICAEYTKNTFSAKDVLSKLPTNLTPCNLKKDLYYLGNGRPDFSRFPPHLPRGAYKMVVNCTYHSNLLYTAEFYGQIKDKPVDWKNIPKHNWS